MTAQREYTHSGRCYTLQFLDDAFGKRIRVTHPDGTEYGDWHNVHRAMSEISRERGGLMMLAMISGTNRTIPDDQAVSAFEFAGDYSVEFMLDRVANWLQSACIRTYGVSE